MSDTLARPASRAAPYTLPAPPRPAHNGPPAPVDGRCASCGQVGRFLILEAGRWQCPRCAWPPEGLSA